MTVVVICREAMIAVVEYAGRQQAYSIGEATAVVIERQFAEFQSITEPLG